MVTIRAKFAVEKSCRCCGGGGGGAEIRGLSFIFQDLDILGSCNVAIDNVIVKFDTFEIMLTQNLPTYGRNLCCFH